MHLLRHQAMLREATSETLESIEQRIRKENPRAFHIESGEDETLSQRRFMDEPTGLLPMAGFECPYIAPPKAK